MCHVGTKAWLSLDLGSLAFDLKQSQTCGSTLSSKLFILLINNNLESTDSDKSLMVLDTVHVVTY